jgi:hypothetical protein
MAYSFLQLRELVSHASNSSAFKSKYEKKRLNCGKDPKHRYDANGHVHKSQRMVRFYGSSAICMLSCN